MFYLSVCLISVMFVLFGVRGCVLLVCCVVLFSLWYALVLYDLFVFLLCVRCVVMCFVCVFDFGRFFCLCGVCGCVLLVCCVALSMLLYALVLYDMFMFVCCVFVLLLCCFCLCV